MSKNLINDLPELVGANIISEETAEQIRSYYKSKNTSPQNRLLIVFGILGAILIDLELFSLSRTTGMISRALPKQFFPSFR